MFNDPCTPRSLLTRAMDGTTLRPLVVPAADFHPQPTIADRAAWDHLPPAIRTAFIAAGENHSIAIRSDGTVVAWGYGEYGQTSAPPDLPAASIVAISPSRRDR